MLEAARGVALGLEVARVVVQVKGQVKGLRWAAALLVAVLLAADLGRVRGLRSRTASSTALNKIYFFGGGVFALRVLTPKEGEMF